MNIGDTITIPFGDGTKEGQVVKLFPNTVWVKVDFPKQPGKLIKRKINALENAKSKPKKKKTAKK